MKKVKLPKGFWKDPQKQVVLMDKLKKELNIQREEDWYSISSSTVEQKGGEYVLRKYFDRSLPKALASLYPHYNWKPWMFGQVPKEYWDTIANQRKYFDWLEDELGIEKKEDWYKINRKEVQRRGGSWVLKKYYGDSLVRALLTVYPDHNWLLWMFQRIPNGSMTSTQLDHSFSWFSKQLGIKTMDDWKYISVRDFYNLKGGRSILYYSGGLYNLLNRFYPTLQFNPNIPKSEMALQHKIRKLFVGEPVLCSYKHPEMRYSASHELMELDIYIPTLSLAFEYQGKQHYSQHYLVGAPSNQISRDREKRQASQRMGITLIDVPHWNLTLTSIVASITKKRADLSSRLQAALESLL
jgi:hypothetical protein